MANKRKPAIPQNTSIIHETPIWRFDLIDRGGKFAFDLSRQDFDAKTVFQKLIDYGCMTWGEIDRQQHDRGKSKHHYLSVESLSEDAKASIKSRQLEDETDAIFSFAFQNMLRVIGIRQAADFHIVWYDPRHEFCPSKR